jgi:hypothetical protein
LFELIATAEPTDVKWDREKSRSNLGIRISEVRVIFDKEPGQEPRFRIDTSRNGVNFWWGNLDKDIILELFRVQREGGISPRLQEIARAMGLDDDGGQH